MTIAQPYYRIWRPFPNDNFFENDYVLDSRYVSMRIVACCALYHGLRRRVEKIAGPKSAKRTNDNSPPIHRWDQT